MNNIKDKIFNKHAGDLNTPIREQIENLYPESDTGKTESFEKGAEEKKGENMKTSNIKTENNSVEKRDLLELALITNGAENTNVNVDNYFLNLKKEIIKILHEKQIPDSHVDVLTNIITEISLKYIKNIAEKYNSLQELMKLETFFGGEKNFNEVSKQITMWATKNLTPDLFNTLNTNYWGVISLYNMMRSYEDKTFIDQEFEKDFLTEKDLKSMMKNPKYWRDKDKNFIAQIDEGWKYLSRVKS